MAPVLYPIAVAATLLTTSATYLLGTPAARQAGGGSEGSAGAIAELVVVEVVFLVPLLTGWLLRARMG